MVLETLSVVARWLVAALFLFSGVSKITAFAATETMMRQYRFPLPRLALLAAIGIELGGGVLLGLDSSTPIVTIGLILYVIIASLMILVPQLGDPALRKPALNHLAKNVAVIGALLRLYVDVLRS